jgi:hypothetical protein
VLIAAGLLATTKPAYRIRRSRPVAALVSGGWISVLAGVLLGPAALGLIDREPIYQSIPLLALGLGWIGFMVGLQLRFSLLKDLPPVVYRVAAADFILTLTLFAAVAFAALAIWIPEPAPAQLALPIAFIVACSLGWSLESRSLGAGFDERLVLLLRASGAILGIAAVIIFGLASKLVERDPAGLLQFTPTRAALKMVHTVALALAVGFIGRYMLRLAGANPGHQLAVFLGLVAFTAGSAKQLDASPLIAAALAGAVVANIETAGFRQFETFIYKAEHTVAILFGLLAGLLLDPVLALPAIGLAFALLVARAALKPLLFRRVALSSRDRSPAGEPLPVRSAIYTAAGRQSPLMLALGVSLVLVEPSVFHKQLLAIMVVAGVLAEIVPAVASRRRSARLAQEGSDS